MRIHSVLASLVVNTVSLEFTFGLILTGCTATPDYLHNHLINVKLEVVVLVQRCEYAL